MPIAFIVVLVVAVLGASTYYFMNSRTEQTPTPTVSETREEDTRDTSSSENDVTPTVTEAREEETTPQNNGSSLTSTAFTNGTYSAQGRYLTPARTAHTVDVTITIENDIVIDSQVIFDGSDGYSNPNQERFDAAYKSQVIGVSLSDVQLSRVGSASLTSESFNDAIALISAEAKS